MYKKKMLNQECPKRVVVYCRVSSRRQVTEGQGLDSQEQTCRAWARQRGLPVDRVFMEPGVSGAKQDRPAFNEMLKFLSETDQNYIVLAFDLNRFARDVVVHGILREQIRKMGHSLQTVNMTLEDTDESELLENVSAALSQYERKKNAGRTKNNMIEHAKQGFWVMRPPVGLKEVRKNGRMHQVRNEPTATFIQTALEGFASCRFLTQRDVFEYLRDKPLCLYRDGRPFRLTYNAIHNLLTNEKYTGYFAYPRWGIPYQKWAMEPLISVETYRAVQERLNGGRMNEKVTRQYNTEDETFPLRRFVRCAKCGKPLTASRPKGKGGKRFLYYHCYCKGCPMYGKGIKPTEIHQALECVLEKITPDQRFIALAGRAIQRAYEEQTADAQQRVAERQALIAQKEREKTQAFNLLMNPNNPPEVVSMCQERISMLTAQIQQLTDEQQVQEIETMPLDQATEYVLQFIRRPLDIWRTGNFKKRQGVLNLCFPEQISYDFAEKFGTPKLAPIFNVFDENVGEIKKWRIQKDSNPQSSDP